MNLSPLRALAALLAAACLLPPLPAIAGAFGDAATVSAVFPRPKGREVREGELLVKFKPSLPAAQRDARHGQMGNAKLRELRRSGIHVVRLAPAHKLDDVIARYQADPDVEFAEPNYVLRPMRLPNDPGFNLLWGLNNTGQTLGTPGADIRAAAAWDLVTGSPNVAVMVIDSGTDYSHPDLVANLWLNPGEVHGNGIDEDGNGWVDDLYGIDVVARDTNPMDEHGHGTHVAGTIGAVGNNAAGISGVAWGVKIITCRILDATGAGSVADAVTCLEYARDLKARGVNIVATNNSYGGLGAYSQTMVDAIAAQPDILFIAAAGNFGIDNDSQPFFPANIDLPNVIAVAATDHNDQRPTFSNFGRRSVHLGAPGVSITSTTPLANYASASGTSMAAPHVTGVAALLAAQQPTRDWRAIKNLILAGGDARPSLAGATVSGRRLNALQSVACSNRPLFSVLGLPPAFTVGVPATVSALSINCASAVGPVTATSSAGESFTLRDDGVAPDRVAGDGVFTASWTPTRSFASLAFSSPAGTEQVGMVDLAVTALTGPPTANRGDTVTLQVTVSNPSSMAAPASTLHLLLSPDAAISTADPLLAAVPVPALAAGAQQTLSTSVTIPATIASGTWVLGAIADPANQIDEGNEGNNAFAGTSITIGNPAVDLAVSALAAPSSAFVGDTIDITASVTNLGTTSAPPSTLNFYLSTDPVITSADTWIGTAAVGAIAGGGTVQASGSVPVPATVTAGVYYVGAIADDGNLVVETDEGNNARTGPTLTASVRPIDLAVTSVSGPNSAKDQQTITLSATVRNYGSVAAPEATLRWVLSTDRTITTADTVLATVVVPSLRGGGSVKLNTTVSIPASVPAGSYSYGAIVDPDNLVPETNVGNNALAGNSVSVSYSVDLVITAVAGPSAGATGQAQTFTATVRNQGLAATAGNVTVGFYASADDKIASNDTLIARVLVPPLAAGASVPVSVTAAIPTALREGVYWVGALADPAGSEPESNEANNGLAGNTVTVSYGPDLVITAISGPTEAVRGQTITLTGTVLNQGIGAVGALSDQDINVTASAVRAGFYLSGNTTITANDLLLGSLPTSSVAPGQSIPLTISVLIPSDLAPGTYYLGAIADFSQGIREASELNNALTGTTIVVR